LLVIPLSHFFWKRFIQPLFTKCQIYRKLYLLLSNFG